MTNIALNIISKLGGYDIVAHIVGIDRSNVHRWTYPKHKGGTGGLIPTRHQATLMVKAKELGIDLQPSDFFNLNQAPIERQDSSITQQNHVKTGE